MNKIDKLKKYFMENKNHTNNIIPIFILITVLTLLLSVGYAALNQNLSISGEAFLRVKEDVRIISIATGTTENDGYETYSPEYYKKSLKLFNTLPQSNSKIVYNGTINNTTGVKYKVTSLTIVSTDSSVECISSLKENDIIAVGKNNFTVTASYKSGSTVDSSNTNSVCTVNYEFDLFDVTPPTLQAQVVSKSNLTATFKITAQDEEGGSGLSDTNKYQYCFSNNASGENCTWKNYTSGTSFSETASSAGTYYLFVYAISDKAGNVSDGKESNQVSFRKTSIQLYKETENFEYTGSEQTFVAPVTGYYRLETWGAQGGGTSGGNGGYATGIVHLQKGDTLYVNVGGQASSLAGGYNGGGTASTNGHGGGGATHIATTTGLLSSLSSKQSDILIASGGGGGQGNTGAGGAGGGISGVKGTAGTADKGGEGGSQTAGGSCYDTAWCNIGTFGNGGSYKQGDNTGAGGGGYYGGGSSTGGGHYAGGGGGSGYIANSNLLTRNNVTKHMYCYNCTTSDAATTKTLSNGTSSCISAVATTDCSKSGNGYAKITLVETDTILTLTPVTNANATSIVATIKIENSTGSELSTENIYKYYVSTSETSLTGGTWKEYTPEIAFVIKKTSDIAYLWVYSISTTDGTINNSLTSKNSPYMAKKLDFALKKEYEYTGGEQTFVAPTDGYYRLETWGAQGGNGSTTYIGGYGGYSTGIVKLNTGDILYVNVGGKGIVTTGGYNGGGSSGSSTYSGGGGGGATHIANKSGILSSLSSSQSNILIVSGGGGGGVIGDNNSSSGGAGGGYIGNSASSTTSIYATPTGGTQTAGGNKGNAGTNGSFGAGSSGNSWSGGGGGGFYGGAGGHGTGGGGGSGYIANSNLLTYDNITKHMYCYNCATSDAATTKTLSNGTSSCVSDVATTDCSKSGNGYAKIALIKADSALSINPKIDMKSVSANITINIENTTDSELSANNVYKYYISTSNESLTGGSWNDYTPGTAFKVTGINETKYLWVYSISTTSGIVNDNFESANNPYMAKALVFVLSPEEYTYTGTSQTFIAPLTGTYEVTLYGAQGGAGGLGLCSGGSGGAGGNGGYVKATVKLVQDQSYIVWVGGKGTDSSYGDTVTGTGGLSDGTTGGIGSGVSGGGGGGGGSTYIALESTVYLRANGGGGGGGGADGGWYRNSSGSTTCGGCSYRNLGRAGAKGGAGGGGTAGGNGASNTCQASGYAGSAGTYYLDSSYATLVESGSTGTGNGRATIKYIP